MGLLHFVRNDGVVDITRKNPSSYGIAWGAHKYLEVLSFLCIIHRLMKGETSLYVFPIYFIGLWLFVGKIISLFGGWNKLSAQYRWENTPTPTRWLRFQSMGLNSLTTYRHCMDIGFCETGLVLKPFILFRFGHPPLFFRWEELSLEDVKRFFVAETKVTTRKVPSVEIFFRKSTGQRLRDVMAKK
jgi:hypothetical protein